MRETKLDYKKLALISFWGILGAILVGISNYMLEYAYTTRLSSLSFLTEGTLTVDPDYYIYIAGLTIAGILIVSIVLNQLKKSIQDEMFSNIYSILTGFFAVGWFMIESMVLFTVAIYHECQAESEQALNYAESFYHQFNFINIIGYIILALLFVYFGYLVLSSSSSLPSISAMNNPIIYYGIFYGISKILPDIPLQVAFSKSVPAMSIALFFLVYMIYGIVKNHKEKSWYHY